MSDSNNEENEVIDDGEDDDQEIIDDESDNSGEENSEKAIIDSKPDVKNTIDIKNDNNNLDVKKADNGNELLDNEIKLKNELNSNNVEPNKETQLNNTDCSNNANKNKLQNSNNDQVNINSNQTKKNNPPKANEVSNKKKQNFPQSQNKKEINKNITNKNLNIEVNNEINIKNNYCSLFTKISEEMFDKLKGNIKSKENNQGNKYCNTQNQLGINYDELVNDQYLYNYSEKYNNSHSNNYKIKALKTESSFLNRLEKENKNNKLGIKEKRIKDKRDAEENKQKEINNKNLNKNPPQKIKNSNFYENQKKYENIKERKIKELKNNINKDLKKTYLQKPKIDKKSKQMVEEKRKKEGTLPSENDVFDKLYEENNKKLKKIALLSNDKNLSIEPSSCMNTDRSKKRVNSINSHISKNTKSSFINNSSLRDSFQSFGTSNSSSRKGPDMKRLRTLSQHKEVKQIIENNASITTGKSSNDYLIHKFLKRYDREYEIIFKKKTNEKINICFDDFASILFQLGFIVKHYQPNIIEKNNTKNVEVEYQLIKNAWVILTREKKFEYSSKVESYKITLFFLIILDLYKGGPFNSSIKKSLPYIDEKNYIFSPKMAAQIKQFFRLLRDNFNSLYKKVSQCKNIQNTDSNSNITNTEGNYSEMNESMDTRKSHRSNTANSSRQITKHNSSNLFHPTKHHLSIVNNYDIIIKKRELELNKKREESKEKELEGCTFFPNGKNLDQEKKMKRSISEEVTDRLYGPQYKKSEAHMSRHSNMVTNRENSRETFKIEENSNNKINDSFSHKPKLTEYNKEMFSKNPLKNDKSVNDKIEQYKEARKEKFIVNLIKEKGTVNNNYKDYENIEVDKQKNNLKSMKFGNEISNKYDTFDKFKNKKNCLFEIKVENDIKPLKIYKGDDIDKRVEKFCKENKYDDDLKNQILQSIKEKL